MTYAACRTPVWSFGRQPAVSERGVGLPSWVVSVVCCVGRRSKAARVWTREQRGSSRGQPAPERGLTRQRGSRAAPGAVGARNTGGLSRFQSSILRHSCYSTRTISSAPWHWLFARARAVTAASGHGLQARQQGGGGGGAFDPAGRQREWAIAGTAVGAHHSMCNVYQRCTQAST